MIGSEHWLAERALLLIPLILSLSVHEWAHAYVAWRLGDDTAEKLGRLTMNPLAHLDPIGTFLLPLLGVPFGWAKPVPFNPLRMSARVRSDVGMMLIAGAGPLSNFMLVLICGAGAAAFRSTVSVGSANASTVEAFLGMLITVNLLLGVFNLLPFAPLDGSRIVESIVPRTLRPLWDRLCSLGFVPLVVLVVLLQLVPGENIFEAVTRTAACLSRLQ